MRSSQVGKILLGVSIFALLSVGPAFSLFAKANAASPSNNIAIRSDSDFTACNCVSGGSGSVSSPYILSGLTIVSKSAPGILIDNTNGKITKHFVISGDTITGGFGPTTNYPGIEFINVNGLGQVLGTQNTFNGNEYGIFLEASSSVLINGGSSSNGATVNNNGISGIKVVGGGSNTIENIQVNHNGIGIPEDFMTGGRGIELDSTTGNTVHNVVLSEDSEAALVLLSSSDNVIDGIVTHYPDFYATIVDGGSGNTLENSVFQTADYVGLWIRDGSSSNLITHNQIIANGPVGREKNPGIVPYFTVGLYLSSGASSNKVEFNSFNNGNTGGSIIQDNGNVKNAVQSPLQTNNVWNDPSTGNEPASPVSPTGPAGSGNLFCGNSPIFLTQGVSSNPSSCP